MASFRSRLAGWGALVGWIAPVACALGLQACAPAVATPAAGSDATAPAHGTAPGLRVELRTVADAASSESLLRQIGHSAGVPVRHLTLLAPRHATLTLACADTASCEQALQRLKADRELVADVQPDRRQRRPPNPPRSTSR